MRIDWQTIQTIVTVGGIAVASIGYFMGQYRKGTVEVQKDTVQNKRDVFDLLQEQVNELEGLVDKQKTDILILKTQVEEKDKKVKEYMEIMQNRNPEMMKFMAYLTDVAAKSEAYMKDTGLVFTEIKKVLSDVSEHMAKTNQHLSKLES